MDEKNFQEPWDIMKRQIHKFKSQKKEKNPVNGID